MAQPRPQRMSRRERLRRLRQENSHRPSDNVGFLESLRQRFNPDRQRSSTPSLTMTPSKIDNRASRRASMPEMGLPVENMSAPRRRRRRSQSDAPTTTDSPKSTTIPTSSPILDVIAIVTWAVLLFRYWRTGKLYLLIHPNYMWLTVAAGVVLMAIAILKLLTLMASRQDDSQSSRSPHVTLFPPALSIALLVTTAILGLVIEPRAFASQTAIQRGITDTLPLTRVKPQTFRATAASDSKSIIDWVRTISVYPEPDAYTGQRVKVQGFVVHPPNLPATHLLISRFVITCCAADVYPVGLPVKLPSDRTAYPVDRWFEVEGVMTTETLDNKRQLVIAAKSLNPIPAPKNPYDY